jgi:fucose permease
LEATTDLVQKNAILDDLLQRVHTPYISLAIIFVAFAIFLKFTHLPEVDVDAEEETSAESGTVAAKKTSIFQYPHLFLGALAIFFCVAVEVMAGDIIGVYARELKVDPFFTTCNSIYTILHVDRLYYRYYFYSKICITTNGLTHLHNHWHHIHCNFCFHDWYNFIYIRCLVRNR